MKTLSLAFKRNPDTSSAPRRTQWKVCLRLLPFVLLVCVAGQSRQASLSGIAARQVTAAHLANKLATKSEIAQSTTCFPPPSGLVSRWAAEGNANDLSSNHNHGQLDGGAGYAAGQVGQAFSFDGMTGQVRVANNANLNVQAITIEAWIKTAGTTNAALAGFIVAKSGVDGLSGCELAIGTPSQNGVLRFVLNGGAGGADLFGTTSVTQIRRQMRYETLI